MWPPKPNSAMASVGFWRLLRKSREQLFANCLNCSRLISKAEMRYRRCSSHTNTAWWIIGSVTYKIGVRAQVTTYKYTEYTVYRSGARIYVPGGEHQNNFIQYMNSAQVLYCNGVATISVRGQSAKTYSSCNQRRF